MRAWAQRTMLLHGELAAIADDEPWWWLLAGGAAAAEPWRGRRGYMTSDAADPASDTFIGYPAAVPHDPVHDAIARARAARVAVRELDGHLPEQPLAVIVQRPPAQAAAAATTEPSVLDVAAFAVGGRCLVAALDDITLPHQLAAVLGGHSPRPWQGPPPFVCVSLGDDALATARHGHRRAWTADGGPWLGLGRTGDLATVSTTHMVVDGYGHARIVGRIAQLAAAQPAILPVYGATALAPAPEAAALPALVSVPGAIPLGIAWRELRQPAPRILPLCYALGQILHRLAGVRDARFSPTFQVPVAPGRPDDPERRKRRVVWSTASVRFDRGKPEPYEVFAARTREIFAREANGAGLIARLSAAASALPAPLAWKRRSISPVRPRWLDRIAQVIGGRGCLSRIAVDAPVPAAAAVSSPPCLASPRDPFGSCQVTVMDDRERASLTVCGSGLAGTPAGAGELLDELLHLIS